jgi:type IV pilus assembly protein PilV
VLVDVSLSMKDKGFSLIEVLIAVVVLAFGLFGLAALQATVQRSGVESVQRSQALLLLQDLVSRIKANGANAADYVVNYVGTGDALDCSPPLSVAEQDLCEWRNALKGTAEKRADSTNIGGVIGGRGCVEVADAGPPLTLRITVAWQGLAMTSAPALSCGQNQYGDERLRRAISSLVTLADLE